VKMHFIFYFCWWHRRWYWCESFSGAKNLIIVYIKIWF